MFKKIIWFFIGIGLFFDYIYDNIYRLIAGMPRLSRCQVTAHLFIGSQYNLLGLKKLKALGVTAIVNMRIILTMKQCTKGLNTCTYLQLITRRRHWMY